MGTAFPGALDTFANPDSGAGDKLDGTGGKPHDDQHSDANDAIEALEAKVGVDGSADTDSLDYLIKNLLPWSIYVNPRLGSAADTNWSTADNNITALRTNTSAQNNEIFFDVVLAAGTWTLMADWATGPSRGIAHVSFDGGADVGTMDSYSGGGATPERRSITGIVIATTGKKRVSFKMASKNASASAYNGYLIGFQFTRTA